MFVDELNSSKVGQNNFNETTLQCDLDGAFGASVSQIDRISFKLSPKLD